MLLVDRNHVKPGVLLVEQRDVLRALHDLDRIGRVHGAHQTKWQAASSVIAAEGGDYTGSCLPFGLMRSMNSPDPIQIMQSPKYVALLYEQNTWFHVIPIDKKHHDGATPTWFGDSVGHWDGDTLVVDTVNFNGRTRLDTIGHPHSNALHVIERFTRTDSLHIAYEVTVDDPKIFTKPWTNKRIFTIRPDWEIMEYSCEENNKDLYEGHIKAPPPAH